MDKKILIIEDDPDIAFLYQSALQESGYTVDTAPDGDSGLKKIQEGAYDLVLLDLMLPGKHGMSVLRELKTNDDTKEIPVYVLSALGDDIVADQASNTGANGYFIKSDYNPGQLVEEIDKLFT